MNGTAFLIIFLIAVFFIFKVLQNLAAPKKLWHMDLIDENDFMCAWCGAVHFNQAAADHCYISHEVIEFKTPVDSIGIAYDYPVDQVRKEYLDAHMNIAGLYRCQICNTAYDVVPAAVICCGGQYVQEVKKP